MIKTLKPLVVLACIAAVLIGGSSYFTIPPDGSDSLKLDQATFIASDIQPSLQRLSSDIAWQPRQLPDNWNLTEPELDGFGTYLLHYQLTDEPGKLWGLFLPRVNMNVAAYVNGKIIGTSGSFEEPMSRNWNRPIYFQIPEGVLVRGDNTLLIRVKAYRKDGGGISEVYIGSHSRLFPVFERWYMLKIELSLVVFYLSLAAAAATLTLWLLRREESMYGCFALSSLACAFYLSNHFMRTVPFSYPLWEKAVHISIGAFVVFLFMFARRYVGNKRNGFEKGLLGYLAFSTVFLVLIPEDALQPVFLTWHIGTLGLAVGMVILIWREWWWKKSYANFIVLQGVLLNLVLGFHDWFIRAMNLQGTYPALMQLGPPIMLGVIAWVLVVQFVKARNDADNFNLILSKRVRETERELALKHQHLQESLRAHAKAEERNRIMQDLHDVLGNYLLSAHAMAETSGEHKPLREALSDAIIWLRASIDALDDAGHDLTSLLATFRHRVTPRLAMCGLTLHWQMGDLGDYMLSAEKRMHLLRIIQEALTNIIKHAKASDIIVSTDSDNGSAVLRIEDNGIGFDQSSSGYGLQHMRERAEALRGVISIESGNSGTTIMLRFPLEQLALS